MYMAKYEKEMQEVVEWLEHPNELGKAPSKIEFTKEFTDPDGIHCLIFRFKKGMLSPWLLAIHSESGIFSEQEKYDEKRDIEQAQAMIDYLKSYWKSMALNEEERRGRVERAEGFHAFILKAEPKFEPDVFLQAYEKEWGVSLQEADEEGKEARDGVDARIYTDENGLMLVLGYMDFKIPEEEAEENARFNFMWKDAVATAASHTAHEIVSVMGDGSLREQAMFYAKAVMTLCQMENNIGVYANGVVYEPKMFLAMSELLHNDQLPIPVLVWCGLGQEEEGISGWTDGMKCFGFDEMEIVKMEQKPSELQNLLFSLVNYCINNDVAFRDGETMSLTTSMQLKIKKSKGINVDPDGETMKLTPVMINNK